MTASFRDIVENGPSPSYQPQRPTTNNYTSKSTNNATNEYRVVRAKTPPYVTAKAWPCCKPSPQANHTHREQQQQISALQAGLAKWKGWFGDLMIDDRPDV